MSILLPQEIYIRSDRTCTKWTAALHINSRKYSIYNMQFICIHQLKEPIHLHAA